MKKLFLFAAILFAGVSVVKAQDGNPVNATANLKVTLHRFQHIAVADADVHLEYNSLDLYKNGAEDIKPEHLVVNSAGAYTVTVESTKLTFGETTFDPTNITVATTGDGAIEGAMKIGFTGSPTTIINNNKGGIELKYDVLYKGAGDYNLMQYSDGKETTVYESTVTYTIAAK